MVTRGRGVGDFLSFSFLDGPGTPESGTPGTAAGSPSRVVSDPGQGSQLAGSGRSVPEALTVAASRELRSTRRHPARTAAGPPCRSHRFGVCGPRLFFSSRKEPCGGRTRTTCGLKEADTVDLGGRVVFSYLKIDPPRPTTTLFQPLSTKRSGSWPDPGRSRSRGFVGTRSLSL
ncbi:hypothetical protein HJG60_010403 [Phyllostomus discolor]|uniref:Uncharacterized protein n=1 Tax=Phyllostomus discolor TaxID=89673 RepID=A0A834AYF5_9CHIR|nr:hypothetical protein HJG60_010403 [Phyllostomus discolor]